MAGGGRPPPFFYARGSRPRPQARMPVMGKRTPLYDKHVVMGAKMVDFAGWDMPLRYGSQIDEHHQVRRDVGMFDVSHMTIVDVRGEDAQPFLRYLLANDVARLQAAGKALYTCMLNHQGGVLDDLIVYFLDPQWFRVVFNAATRDKDLAWAREQAGTFSVQLVEAPELAMIAVQGPNAVRPVRTVLGMFDPANIEGLAPFTALHAGDVFVSRTGYTGEDGYEIMLPGAEAGNVWRALHGEGVPPIGLGARDSLRLEAGMNLYGTDMDETTSPLESGLGWTVAWEPTDRAFIGRESLEQQRAQGLARKFVGLVLADKGVLRNHQQVLIDGEVRGEVTSGGFSPTLGRSIALARVASAVGETCEVDIRGKAVSARVVRPPFVRNGKPRVEV